jgi:uncharacterized membrane protein
MSGRRETSRVTAQTIGMKMFLPILLVDVLLFIDGLLENFKKTWLIGEDSREC